jgi:UDP-N-acetylmuramoylalanine--D-glutamate ligase
VVLIAGGLDLGLDLSVLRGAADHVRSVVAIGQAAPVVEAAFAGIRPVQWAGSMRDAVELAAADAHAGDAVVLSPACSARDWYRDEDERGDDFTALVRSVAGSATTGEQP